MVKRVRKIQAKDREPVFVAKFKCGHSIRSRHDPEKLRERVERFDLCPRCHAFARRQLVFRFPR